MAEPTPLDYARAGRTREVDEATMAVSSALDSLGRVAFDSRGVEDAIGGARLALLLLLGILAREGATVGAWYPPKKKKEER